MDLVPEYINTSYRYENTAFVSNGMLANVSLMKGAASFYS